MNPLIAFSLLGPGFFFRKLRLHLFSKTHYFTLVYHLDRPHFSEGKVTLKPASPEEVAHFFSLMAKDSRPSRYELLIRKKFYEQGFHDCYIGRTTDSGEIFSISWFVTSRDIYKTSYGSYYPRLEDGDVFGENMYILENFRGKGLARLEMLERQVIAQKQGYTRMFFYIREDNIPQLISSRKVGDLVWQRIVRYRILFRAYTKTVEQFDPPIRIPIPENSSKG